MKRLLLVDFLGTCYTHFHAKEKTLLETYIGIMREMIYSFKVDRVILLREGGSNYRNELYPEYKSARKAKREKYTEAEKAEYEKFQAEVEEVAKMLVKLGCVEAKHFGAEADDLAGYYCEVLRPEEYQILLLSDDSDWSQLLVRKNTVQASYRTFTKTLPDLPKELWLNYKTFTEQKGLNPIQWYEKKVLTGDTSDSIPGIFGLGDTSAFKLIEKYESLENVLLNVENLDIPRMPQKAKDNLAVGKEVLELGHKMMNLRWSEQEWINILKLNEVTTSSLIGKVLDPVPEINFGEFKELCYEYGWLDYTDPQWLMPYKKLSINR